MTIRAYYDGKVIVPDQPLGLAPNQVLIVQIEPVSIPVQATVESALTWIAANAIAGDDLPTDLADQHNHYLYGVPKDKRS